MAKAPTLNPGGLVARENVAMSPTQADRIQRQLNGAALLVYSADGAIVVANHLAVLTKGTAAAMTLAAPTATTDDGIELEITSTTAAAHVITLTSGVLQDGTTAAKTTITFAAFAGASVRLRAYQAKWYLIGKSVATIA